LGQALAAAAAGIVTYLEMDKVFFVPRQSPGRWAIWGISLLFVAGNSALAIALYALVVHAGILQDVERWLLGLMVGASYLGLVRSKFATLNGQAFGFEYLYELAKEFAYVRLNRRVKEARRAGAEKLANKKSLSELVVEANFHAGSDSLTSEKEKKEIKAWILRVIGDIATPDSEKRLVLADYILSGKHP
jgi:hypothetical protein